jgi:hypothetical protein
MNLFKLTLVGISLASSLVFADDLSTASKFNSTYLLAQNMNPEPLRNRLAPARQNDFDVRKEGADTKADRPKGSSSVAQGSGTKICPGEFALCASSTCVTTGRQIEVKENGGKTTRKYPEVSCKCPIITEKIAVEQNGVPLVGIAAVNEGNMNGSCTPPSPGTIWSYFSNDITLYPQESATPSFSSPGPSVKQTCSAGSGTGSNCWDYLCKIDPNLTNGVRTATCLCPYGEALFGAKDRASANYVTFAGGYSSNPAAACSQYPVGFPQQLLQ